MADRDGVQKHPYKSLLLTAAAQTPEKRIEIINAIRTLTAPDGDDQFRKRRADIAALRGDLEKLRQDVLELWRQREPRARSYVIKYSPDQPRVSAGNPGGEQWTSERTDDVDSTTAVGQSPPAETTPEQSSETADLRSIIDTARQLNISARPDAYEKCLDLCYPLLERFQPPGSNRNTWDFHKCMNACLCRDL